MLCSICSVQLSSDVKEIDGKLFCAKDYFRLVSTQCASCRQPILERSITAMGKNYHLEVGGSMWLRGLLFLSIQNRLVHVSCQRAQMHSTLLLISATIDTPTPLHVNCIRVLQRPFCQLCSFSPLLIFFLLHLLSSFYFFIKRGRQCSLETQFNSYFCFCRPSSPSCSILFAQSVKRLSKMRRMFAKSTANCFVKFTSIKLQI